MSLTYTTQEAIANRLRGRLQVGGLQVPFQPTTVDENLILQVGEQVEARVNAKLGSVYKLPLIGVHPVLASVVEKLVICELMGTHFVGQEANPQDGYGRMMCKQGADELADILSGATPLDGETLVSGDAAPASSNYSRVAARKPVTGRDDAMGVKW